VVVIDRIREFYDNYLDKLAVPNNRHSWVFYSLDRFIPKNCTVLDIGCGTGITSRHLAKNGRIVTAIDLSPKLIEYAKEHNSHENITYLAGDVCDMDSPGVFDAIVLVDVLEHVIPDSLDKLFQVLGQSSNSYTKIYLNVPTYDVLRFLHENKPETRQIIDNPIPVDEILSRFKAIDFIPTYFQLYWSHYAEYLFVSKEEITQRFTTIFLG
jgi:SAM-dependent methyltransferase